MKRHRFSYFLLEYLIPGNTLFRDGMCVCVCVWLEEVCGRLGRQKFASTLFYSAIEKYAHICNVCF